MEPHNKMLSNKKFIASKFIIFCAIIICIVIGMIVIISGCTKNIPNTLKDESLDLFCENCNVIFLNIELLRADYVGLISREHGNNITPNIDKFFENSIIFEDVSAPAGSTPYSNVATMIGEDGFLVRSLFGNTTIETPLYISKENELWMRNYESIAEKLYADGYYTINRNTGEHSGKGVFLDRGFEDYAERFAYNDAVDNRYMELVELINKIELIESHQKYFLLMHTVELHGNLPFKFPKNVTKINNSKVIYVYENKTEKYFVTYQIHKDGSPITTFSSRDGGNTVMWESTYEPEDNDVHWMNDSIYQEYHDIAGKVYAEEVRFVDRQLQPVFEYLENSGAMNNTIVVLYANHGDGFYDNYVRSHSTSYQSNIHVPLLIRHPKLKKKIEITQAVSLIDLAPTLYDMLNLRTRENSTKISMLPLITGHPYPRTYLFGINPTDRYIRYQDMKLIKFDDNRKELYNITADPHELNNIATAYPETVKELSDALTEHEIAMQEEYKKQYGKST